MRDREWIVGQLVLAGLLLLVGTVIVLGEAEFGWRPRFGTFVVWGVVPGAALSFVVNALVMRRHGAAGLARYEKVLLVIQVVAFAIMTASIVASEASAFFVLLYGVPLYVILAVVVLGAAVERNRHLNPRGPKPNEPSEPPDQLR